eukprot:759887-Hanusia_phi.AAC.1
MLQAQKTNCNTWHDVDVDETSKLRITSAKEKEMGLAAEICNRLLQTHPGKINIHPNIAYNQFHRSLVCGEKGDRSTQAAPHSLDGQSSQLQPFWIAGATKVDSGVLEVRNRSSTSQFRMGSPSFFAPEGLTQLSPTANLPGAS